MRFVTLFLFFLSSSALVAAAPGGSGCSAVYGDLAAAPQQLLEAWLKFHEIELCQQIDVVFYFSRDGMEAWCLVEDEKHYRKLEELFKPLQDSYGIYLYATHPAEDKESKDNWDPPPSLWENQELRSYLGDFFPAGRIRVGLNASQGTDYPVSEMILIPTTEFPSPDEVLKQRLLVYAEEILERSLKIKRYAQGLPAFVRVARRPASAPAIRARAEAVCRKHVEELEKTLEKLERNLSWAFPKTGREASVSSEEKEPAGEAASLLDLAENAAKEACNVFRCVDNFVRPKRHTVGLEELRNPGLLEAVRGLERAASDFRNALASSENAAN